MPPSSLQRELRFQWTFRSPDFGDLLRAARPLKGDYFFGKKRVFREHWKSTSRAAGRCARALDHSWRAIDLNTVGSGLSGRGAFVVGFEQCDDVVHDQVNLEVPG